jgi:hypothetical protein
LDASRLICTVGKKGSRETVRSKMLDRNRKESFGHGIVGAAIQSRCL